MKIIVILLFLFLLGCNHRPIKKKINIKTNKLKKGYKIAHLSDFHSGKLNPVLSWIQEEKPDMILITGDLFDKRRKTKNAENIIEALCHIAPIYYVTGNHEFQHKQCSCFSMKKFLVSKGVKVLENESCVIEDQFCLYGFNDCLQFPTGSEYIQEKELINAVFSQCYDEKNFNLVMIHRPHHYFQFNEYKIDLMLSGHAHGGQWRIPGVLNGLIAPQQGFFPKRAGGIYPIHGGIQLVSRGIGSYWWLPRFLNRPEMIFIDLQTEHYKERK